MTTESPPRNDRGRGQASAAVRVDPDAALRALSVEMDRRAVMLADSAASLIDPVKLKGVVLSAFTRTPSLWDCDPVSIARAVVEAAQAGLEPTGSLGGAYLVPFFNSKTGRREAQLVIGYTGLVRLARRSGEIAKVEARIVRQQDDFDFGYGLAPYLNHKPALGVPEDSHNPMTHAYAIAFYRDGTTQFDVMSAAEILVIKARSKSRDRNGNPSGPWATDEAEMWKKTPLRRMSKLLPLTVEAQRLLDAEDDSDHDTRPATVRVLRPVAPSRIAARVIGHPDATEAPQAVQPAIPAEPDEPPPVPSDYTTEAIAAVAVNEPDDLLDGMALLDTRR